MRDDSAGGLFDDPYDEEENLPGYDQEGPDLFGLEPGEVIVSHEPTAVAASEVDLDEDEMDEIPIDATDEPENQVTPAQLAATEAERDDEVEALAAQAPAPARAAEPSDRREAPLALYRRYRPDTFADVIGQDHVTEPLRRALVNNRVNHAYLFSGPRGCGKTTSARILARCLNCEQGPTPEPCGVCQSCRDLARGGAGSIDVIEIDAASHGGVNEARDLRERAFFAPVHSRYKIYIIDEAHMVTKEGFNALLKLVEEPPPHVKFIFATTEPEKVLGTIRSRTHHYPFRLVPPKVLSAYLAHLCEAEGVAVDTAVLPLVVRAGAGSVRDSLSVLDQLLGGSGESGVSYRQATALLGYTPDTLLDEIMDAFAAGDAQGVFACVDKVIEVGQDPRRFAEDLLRRLRDLIIVAAVPDALTSGLVDVAGDQAERLIVQARGMGAGELTRAAEVIAKGLTDMRGTTAPRLHLELMCSRVLLPGADVDARGVHARLDRLERRLNMVGESGAASGHVSADTAGAVPTPAAPAGRAGGQPAPAQAPAQAPAPAPSDARRPTIASSPAETGASPAPVAGSAPAAEGAPARGGDLGTLSTAEVRRMWPQILDAVKGRRRVTWIVLSQNAQVHSFVDGVLMLAMSSAGARESFGRGGSPDVLRESIIEVLGIAPTIETMVGGGDGPGGQPGPTGRGGPAAPGGSPASGRGPASPAGSGGHGGRGTAPTGGAMHAAGPAPRVAASVPEAGPSVAAAASAPSAYSPEPPPDDDEDRPDFASLARQNIRNSHLAPAAAEPAQQDRDDEDLDDSPDVDELLKKELGAELLFEDPGQA